VGTTHAKLALFRIKDIQVPALPLDRQLACVAQYEALRDVALAAETEATSLRLLRSILLSILLSGEREIPESYDRFLDDAA
jgi:hypothetical protein